MDKEDGAFRAQRVSRPQEQVESQIRQAILDGEFRPGDRLPSAASLARNFGVSRSTIREALRALSGAGLITTSPGASGGSFVEAIDHHSLSQRFGESVENIMRLGSITYPEVADVRLMLEVPSARMAARARTEEDLAELDRIVEEEKRVAVSDPSVPSLNAEFHRVVARASGNRLFASLISALHYVTHPLDYIDTSAELGRQSVIHHIRIVAAVRDRNEGAAAAAMETHLMYLREKAIDSGAWRDGSYPDL